MYGLSSDTCFLCSVNLFVNLQTLLHYVQTSFSYLQTHITNFRTPIIYIGILFTNFKTPVDNFQTNIAYLDSNTSVQIQIHMDHLQTSMRNI